MAAKKKAEPFNQGKYIQEYMKKNNVRIQVILNRNTDKEIIEHLETKKSKSGYIKELIKKDIGK